jgi:hypothetical protein
MKHFGDEFFAGASFAWISTAESVCAALLQTARADLVR